jgi:exopolyphosphatase/guanosine-5'-triphosphate,3'-diphosphate pyrophosphatase
VFGTSAFRSAENCAEVLQAVKEDSNIDIEILSGEDEAKWTYTGATFGLSIAPDSYVTVLDIGGGSTEVVVGNKDTIAFGHSYDIGVVRLREKFFRQYPILPNERAAALTCINKAFRPLHQQQYWTKKPTLIGVAGTATTLACLAKGLAEYDAERVGGTILTYDKVNELSIMLQQLTLDELRALPCVDENRADVLPAGALLLQVFMNQFNFSSMLVSERGVRYGVAIREYVKSKGTA